MKKARLIPLLLALVMALSMTPAFAYSQDALVPQAKTYAAPFPDTQGTWCESYVQTVYEAGLMEGKTAQRFDARGTLTNAQIVTVCARLHDLLTGGDGEIPLLMDTTWYLAYYNAMAPLLGYESGQAILNEGSWAPEEQCSRLSFVYILTTVLKAAGKELPSLNQVTAIPDLDPTQLGEGYANILAFYNAGVLNGSDAYGTFRPLASLTRGEAAAMLARLVDPAQRLTFTLTPFDFCRDLLRINPETVVCTVNGTDVTMGAFAPLLAQTFFAAAHPADITLPDQTVPDILTWSFQALRRSAAMAVLAEEREVTVAEDAAAAAAAAKAGFAGIRQQDWLRWEQQKALEAALEEHYYKTYGHNSPLFHSDEPDGWTRLTEDRDAAELGVTIASTGVLEGLDWAAVGEKAKATPYVTNLFRSGV